jgi:flagellar hook-length control protein FliK
LRPSGQLRPLGQLHSSDEPAGPRPNAEATLTPASLPAAPPTINPPTTPTATGQAIAPPAPLTPTAVDEIVQHARLTSTPGQTTLRLRLQPAELGAIDISINVSARGTSVELLVASPEARQAVEQQLPLLRTNLEQSGLPLERLSVAMPGAATGSLLDTGQSHQHQPQRQGGSPWRQRGQASTEAVDEIANVGEHHGDRPLGLVDYRV